MHLVEDDCYVIADDRLEALNHFLNDYFEKTGEEYGSHFNYEVSKSLYGLKKLTFPWPTPGDKDAFRELTVTEWISLVDESRVMGHINQ